MIKDKEKVYRDIETFPRGKCLELLQFGQEIEDK